MDNEVLALILSLLVASVVFTTTHVHAGPGKPGHEEPPVSLDTTGANQAPHVRELR